MNKKMRELLAEIQNKTAEAKTMDDIDKASELMDEVDALQKAYELEKRIFDAEKNNGSESANDPVEDNAQADETEEKELNATEMIAKEVRAIMNPKRFGNDKKLVESVDADGGYTVPEDIQTKVNRWAEAEASFLEEISVENVNTNKGARTYQKKADVEAFIDLDENGAITKEITAPQFERITYNIQDRAGFMPVSNDLISDSDANIEGIVVEWLGRANVATANAKIKAILTAHKNPKGGGKYETTAGMTKIDGVDGIKKIINVILGQAYKGNAKIITNDDGLQYLDTLKDENGRYMLNPDPTDASKLQLRCGTTVVPVSIKPNKGFESDGNKVPFIIGNLKEGMKKYNRNAMSLKASDVATIGEFNAFAMNMTLIRAILRDDYKEIDKDSYYYGYIDITPTVTASK